MVYHGNPLSYIKGIWVCLKADKAPLDLGTCPTSQEEVSGYLAVGILHCCEIKFIRLEKVPFCKAYTNPLRAFEMCTSLTVRSF
jgi:hypothetical protein